MYISVLQHAYYIKIQERSNFKYKLQVLITLQFHINKC
uniref:Uncharacterized protein n=1 Tax=Arundo donax TaxID=35708 RepID=A0A0A9FB80_ARUDO